MAALPPAAGNQALGRESGGGQIPQIALFPAVLEGLFGKEEAAGGIGPQKENAPAASFPMNPNPTAKRVKATGSPEGSSRHAVARGGSLALALPAPGPINPPEAVAATFQAEWHPSAMDADREPVQAEPVQAEPGDPLGNVAGWRPARLSLSFDLTPVPKPQPAAAVSVGSETGTSRGAAFPLSGRPATTLPVPLAAQAQSAPDPFRPQPVQLAAGASPPGQIILEPAGSIGFANLASAPLSAELAPASPRSGAGALRPLFRIIGPEDPMQKLQESAAEPAGRELSGSPTAAGLTVPLPAASQTVRQAATLAAEYRIPGPEPFQSREERAPVQPAAAANSSGRGAPLPMTDADTIPSGEPTFPQPAEYAETARKPEAPNPRADTPPFRNSPLAPVGLLATPGRSAYERPAASRTPLGSLVPAPSSARLLPVPIEAIPSAPAPLPPEIPAPSGESHGSAAASGVPDVRGPQLLAHAGPADEGAPGPMFRQDAPSPAGGDTRAGAGPDVSDALPEFTFQGRLIPLPVAEKRAPGDSPRPVAGHAGKLPGSIFGDPQPESAESAGQETGTAESPAVRGAAQAEGRTREAASGEESEANPAARPRKLGLPPALREESPSAVTGRVAEPAAGPRSESGGRQPDAPRAAGQAAHPEALESRSESEPCKAPAAPRDIRLEVNSGSQRVEVRVADRGGDVHVAVHTSDANLAEALRDDLPALSSRLEQTGLRAEAWHTSPSADDWRRNVEHPAGSSPQDSNSPPRQDPRQQQGEPQRQRPGIYEEQPHRKEKGKEFAWFMSSLG